MNAAEAQAKAFTIMESALAEITGAGEKYGGDENLTHTFDHTFALNGLGYPVGAITEKLERFKRRGDMRDLRKAMAWLILLTSKMEEGGAVWDLAENDSSTTSG